MLRPGDPAFPAQRPRSEDAHQEWAATLLRNRGVLFQASVAGAFFAGSIGQRCAQAQAYQRRGASKGFPDMYILQPGARGEPGAYIEWKAEGVHKLKTEQHEWSAALRGKGYACEMVNTCQGFLEFLARYVDGAGRPFTRNLQVHMLTIASLSADLQAEDPLARLLAEARLRALNEIHLKQQVREQMRARFAQIDTEMQQSQQHDRDRGSPPSPPPRMLTFADNADDPIVLD